MTIAMERQAVDSSAIASVGYDSASKILEVEFHSGRVYQYYNVPKVIYDNLMTQTSVGSYFNTNIRNSYAYSRV